MAPIRLPRRRRSSVAALAAVSAIKAGHYGIPSPRAVTFAPNVTPGTYADETLSEEDDAAVATIFPPSEAPSAAPTRKRNPPGRRRSVNHIPRPPNAFMLFRADFVRQKHVPGSIETNHGSLSKIIGNCWRSLPLEEKRVWEIKAKHEKAAHKARYPDYRFRPVHNKNKKKDALEKEKVSPEEERRCEDVAQLLLEGKKGDELARAVRQLDLTYRPPPSASASPPSYAPPLGAFPGHHVHRRSSSVPPPSSFGHYGAGAISIPAMPFFAPFSRPTSPVSNIARGVLGQRRASSVQPIPTRSWLAPAPPPDGMQRGHSPLPDVDTSLFEPSFLTSSPQFSFPDPAYAFSEYHAAPTHLTISPYDSVPPHELTPLSAVPSTATTDFGEFAWLSLDAAHSPHTALPHPLHPHLLQQQQQQGLAHPQQTPSHPSTAYSGSPAPSDMSLPVVYAPRPQHPAPAHGAAPAGALVEFDAYAFQHAQGQSQQPQGQVHHHQGQPQQPLAPEFEYDYARAHGLQPQACAPPAPHDNAGYAPAAYDYAQMQQAHAPFYGAPADGVAPGPTEYGMFAEDGALPFDHLMHDF